MGLMHQLGAVFLQHLFELQDRLTDHLLGQDRGKDEYGFVLIHRINF